MIDVKGDFRGGLNLDDSPYALPKSCYIDAQNITRDAIAGSNDNAITNVLGNESIPYELPGILKIKTTFPYKGDDTKLFIEFYGPDVIPANVGIDILYVESGTNYSLISSTTTSDTSLYDYALSISSGIASQPIVNSSTPYLNTILVDLNISTTSDWSSSTVQSQYVINQCIGAYSNLPSNNVIYFIYNQYGNHEVLSYDINTQIVTRIFENKYDSGNIDVLQFSNDKRITSINVFNYDTGDLLYFIDTEGRPTYMDVSRLSSKYYKVVTRELLEVIKVPPLYPVVSAYSNDTSRQSNYLTNKLFRFKYRYVYNNYEKSTCSPISQLSYPNKILDDVYTNNQTNNNLINITADSGNESVRFIEILMSYSNKTNEWSDFALVESIDKENGILLNYQTIISIIESIVQYQQVEIKFSGYIIPAGTNINISYNTPSSPTIIANYVTIASDTIQSIIANLVAAVNASPSNINAVASGNSIILDNQANTFNTFNNIFIDFPQDVNIDNQQLKYQFYNDGVYPYIDINESILLYDYVPLKANAQDLANGNVLVYGGITEGYDRDLQPDVKIQALTYDSDFATIVSTLSYNLKEQFEQDFNNGSVFLYRTGYSIYFYGMAGPGTVTLNIKNTSTNVVYPITVTTTAGMSNVDVVNLFVAALTPLIGTYEIKEVSLRYQTSQFAELYIKFEATGAQPVHRPLNVVISITSSSLNVIPTFLHSTQRKLGIAYFDQYGRTNGILYSDKVNIPPYSENPTTNAVKLPYIHAEIFHQPPVWAHSFSFYLTKETTQFLYWISTSLKTDIDFIYLNITNLTENANENPTTATVLSYSFKEGDRLRFIRRFGGTTFYPSNCDGRIIGVVVDPIISGTASPGKWIKLRIDPAFPINNDKYVIQIYTPPQTLPNSVNEVFYEFGQSYPIGNPGTDARYHFGLTQNQTGGSSLNVDVNTYSDLSIIRFTGDPINNTTVSISVFNINTSTTTLLASYTTNNDTASNIALQLNLLLQPYVGSILTSSILNDNTISIVYDSNTYLISQQEIVVTLPTNVPSVPATFDFYYGDVYFKNRKILVQPAGGLPSVYNTIACLDRNFVDTYISAVNSIEGRPNIIDINIKNEYFPAFIRHGQAIQPNTNINGLNRFYPTTYQEVDGNFGDIQRLKVRDRFMRVFQRLKVGKIPLYQQIVKNADTENLVVSDRLLNPINYYVGDVGIGDNPESLASFNYADYFTSNIKGVICRINESGVEFLSITKKVNSWANAWVGNQKGRFMIGAFDQRLSNYILALSGDFGNPQLQGPATIVYDDEIDNFETFLTMYPEMMVTAGVNLISFKNGTLYIHNGPNYNSWYGNPSDDSYIKPIFNENPYVKKTFVAFSEVASDLWDVPEITTSLNQQSNLVESDFINMEGTFEAPILRDANSPGGVIDGDILKGKYIIPTIRKNSSSLVALNIVSLKYIASPLTNT